ncbi:isopenicillin N synthase family dioxygenase [Leeia aquatica]|uniref:2-oxoglutarate-dependent ethylene/succinate-forming enzyme n=1 Tax=Leeia aquatica TaxID=2725557 RepID=A0A847SFG3_9NEIS|nr:isopenicillin N synthase family oxygenase [Leeia aquatica]NLR75958.1 isopenicillin N synthase family oxygenase [Leeia aquatica]
MTTIPVIDLTPARLEGEAGMQRVAADIDRACRESGFFVVKGHGYAREIFAEAHAASKTFFQLPLTTKNQCRLSTGATLPQDPYTPYGYSGLLEENAFAYMGQQGKPSDYVEKISAGRLILNDNESLPFPDSDLGRDLRQKLKRYYQACDAIALNLTELFTIPLGVHRTYFSERMDRANDSMRSQLYPGLSAELLNDQGMGAHTDGTVLTLLTQTAPGIQVRINEGEWVAPVTADVDHIIVNIGDLMAHWSNHEYVSTEHRVVLGSQERQSIVFFKLTNEDELVQSGNKQMDALFGRENMAA